MDDKRPFHDNGTYLTEQELKMLARARQDWLMYNAVFKKFREIFLVKDEDIRHTPKGNEWAPNGENSIHIKFMNGETFVFTYYDESHWTVDFKSLTVGFNGRLYMLPVKGE
jgi:hypothetical protein